MQPAQDRIGNVSLFESDGLAQLLQRPSGTWMVADVAMDQASAAELDLGERALVVLEKGELPEWLVRPVSDSAVTHDSQEKGRAFARVGLGGSCTSALAQCESAPLLAAWVLRV
jgi:hypothetical protein